MLWELLNEAAAEAEVGFTPEPIVIMPSQLDAWRTKINWPLVFDSDGNSILAGGSKSQ